MVYWSVNGKCQLIVLVAIVMYFSFGIGVCKSHEQKTIPSSPFFKVESTKSGQVWADPQFGVWLSRTGPWSSTHLSLEESRKAIENSWPNAGLSDRNYTPILRDTNGGIWFFSYSGYDSGICYARFDGERWVQPQLPDACLNAPPRIHRPGGPRYHKKGMVDPNGNSIFFEDLGVLIWKNNGWIYGSFYDYGTYPKPDDEHRQGWPAPIYLRTEARSAVSPEGIVWLWAIPESNNYEHVPLGVKCILRWDGTSLIAEKDFRGIPAEQIRAICFLPNGDAWVLATPSAKSGKAWPVLVGREPNSNAKSSTQLNTTSGEVMDLLHEGGATLLFDSGEHVYVAIERGIFKLLPNGLCHEMSDYPWNSIYGNWGFSYYKVGPKSIWLVAMINRSHDKGLFYWNGERLFSYDIGMGRFVKGIAGVGPDGRVYLTVGDLDTFVVSINPHSRPNRPITPVVSTLKASLVSVDLNQNLSLDNQGRMCAYEIGPLWPPTQCYESNKWKELWKPQEPNLPPWRFRAARPPVNVLESANSRESIAHHFDEICMLLSQPDASFYRHRLRPLGNNRILWWNENPSIYDGMRWTHLSDLLDSETDKMKFENLLLMGLQELWILDYGQWYCVELPADKTSPAHIKHVVKKIRRWGRLGVDKEKNVWNLSLFGPRLVCKILPERLAVKDQNSKLCAVDRNKRIYVVTHYKGLLTVSNGRNKWSGFHDSLVSPAQEPRFDFDSRGRIWCCSSMGLLVWDTPSENGGELKLLHFEPRGSLFRYDHPCFDVYGNLWLSFGRLIPNAGKIEFIGSNIY